jgi:uncharacterized membrane protein YfcA
LAVLLPPIGLLAALRYYRAGHVEFAVAGLLALGFFFGASIGAIIATKIEGHILRKVFGGFLFLGFASHDVRPPRSVASKRRRPRRTRLDLTGAQLFFPPINPLEPI